MSILFYRPKNFNKRPDIVKDLSIKHKTFDCDKLIVNTSYKGVNFELHFRNYYKHRILECTVFHDGFKNKLSHDVKSFITGHDFIQFINRICNNIEGV